MSVNRKPSNKVGLIIFRRPVVSARKPHKWELVIIPANPMELNIPFSLIDKCKSFFETGKTKLMANVSNRTLAKIKPDINTIK